MKCCDITPGMLIHKVEIQRAALTADGQGGFVKLWSTLKTKRAFVKPMSGNERVFAHRLDAQLTHKVYWRWDPSILASDRILFKGRPIQIRALINIEERDRWAEVMAEEGVAT